MSLPLFQGILNLVFLRIGYISRLLSVFVGVAIMGGERLLSTRNMPLKRRFYGNLGAWK
jgi:hypothetical protein